MAREMVTRVETVGNKQAAKQAERIKLKPRVKLPPIPKKYKDLAASPPDYLLMLVLWKFRHANPEMAVTINDDDVKSYHDCINYLDVSARMLAEPHQTYVAIRMADKDGNSITPIENNERDKDRADEERRRNAIKQSAGLLVATARAEDANGILSRDTINQLCDAITVLAKS